MTLENAKAELEKFVSLKTTMRPAFVQPLLDAVEVVRCKDCAYWGTKVVYANGERADCLNFNFVTPCEFFCKWGERREDADT